jgi:hypothetical protein
MAPAAHAASMKPPAMRKSRRQRVGVSGNTPPAPIIASQIVKMSTRRRVKHCAIQASDPTIASVTGQRRAPPGDCTGML